jgi:16S rRNA (cytosine967-C5)-methyltransferase
MPKPKRPQRSRKPARKPRVLVADSDVPGLPARKAAAEILFAVLYRQRAFDEALEAAADIKTLPDRDRALVRMLVATVLRRLGTLRALIGGLMEKGLPKDAAQVEVALLLGAAQILFLDVPDHAAVDLSVRLATGPRNARYAGLVNAVLRRLTREGRERYAAIDSALDTPAWLRDRWRESYGEATSAAIMQAHRTEPPLDLTARRDASQWAEKLGAVLLPNGTIRVTTGGNITGLPGFAEGAWWVQDVAASIPARLLGDVAGKHVADLCAAPGGKTAQLANAGANVVAVDRSVKRIERLKENLARLSLNAETVVADATEWNGGPFDAVLLDAPCTATGTIRRHPDLPWQKQPADLAALTGLQTRLLDRAADIAKPGGLLVYATCSLEPEEGEAQIESFLARHANFALAPVAPAELLCFEAALTARGVLRILPCHLTAQGGCDGFFAARLRRNA